MIRYTSGVDFVSLWRGSALDRLDFTFDDSAKHRVNANSIYHFPSTPRTESALASRPPIVLGPSGFCPIQNTQPDDFGPTRARFFRCAIVAAVFLRRAGHTESGGSTSPGWQTCAQPGVLAEVVNDDGTMARFT